MNIFRKALLVVSVIGSATIGVAAPANAGVSVGIGIGLPGPAPAPHPGRWCYWHPGACGYYRPGYYAPGFVPVVGTFYDGRGWWDGQAWYHDRFWGGGHWRYR